MCVTVVVSLVVVPVVHVLLELPPLRIGDVVEGLALLVARATRARPRAGSHGGRPDAEERGTGSGRGRRRRRSLSVARRGGRGREPGLRGR